MTNQTTPNEIYNTNLLDELLEAIEYALGTDVDDCSFCAEFSGDFIMAYADSEDGKHTVTFNKNYTIINVITI